MLKKWEVEGWGRGEEKCFMWDRRKPAWNTGDLANLD